MERKASAKIIIVILGGILIILLLMLGLLPALNDLFAVKVVKQDAQVITSAPVPDKPEKIPVTVYYVMEDDSKKITRLYLEIFHSEAGRIFYMEIPTDTKADLSEGLYKSLQTYGPELPQHLKLTNLAESFSVEYGLAAGNRILSELLGVSLKEYVKTSADALDSWLKLQEGETTDSAFFEAYSNWLGGTTSSRTVEERWTYYESRRQVADVVTETVPGSREKDGYRISSKRAKERLEEMMRGTETVTE